MTLLLWSQQKLTCCKVQDKQTVTMDFWFSISGVGAMPTCCAVLWWWHYFTPVPDAYDYIQHSEQTWGQLMPGYSKQQGLHADQLLWEHSQRTLSQMVWLSTQCFQLRSLDLWILSCISCLSWASCALILPLILWFDLWACFVLWTFQSLFVLKISNQIL